MTSGKYPDRADVIFSNSMRSIDLNCDIGEHFGAYKLDDDEALMDHVSSVNIACGFHAGDPSVMRRTVELAVKKKLAIGAHPGYHDLQGFGRRKMSLSSEEVYDIMLYQIGALSAFVKVSGGTLHHVKPHGALYNSATRDRHLARAIARAVRDVNKDLILVGLSGSVLVEEGKATGLITANEAFADRCYTDEGDLLARTIPGAMIEDPEQAAHQVLQILTDGMVTSRSGRKIPVIAETICIHGDGKHASAIAGKVVNTLREHGITIRKP